MAEVDPLHARREYAQLIALHSRLQTQLERIRDELVAGGTTGLVRDIKSRTGSAPDLTDVVTAVEEAIRAFELSDAALRSSVDIEASAMEVEGITNLPPHLQRFLAERSSSPSFSYRVEQDHVRGWLIIWKEYTHMGTIRGFGQFYEKPHAWLDD